MIVQDHFREKFEGKIGQVFMYLIDVCNATCVQCYYKVELTFQHQRKKIPYYVDGERKLIPFEEAVGLLKVFRDLGAIKVTFMGGEPTLHPELPKLIHEAKQLGFKYVRIDTNGLFDPQLLDNPLFQELDEITFSLDGRTEEANDKIRGTRYYKRCVPNIMKAVETGFKVHLTSCVTQEMIRDTDDEDEIELTKMIKFAKSLGVETVNLHSVIKGGMARDAWTGDIHTTYDEYDHAASVVSKQFSSDLEIGKVRLPQGRVEQSLFNSNPTYYGYCSVREFDRLLAFPNGMLRVCSLLIGTPFCVGYYDTERVYLNETPTNELKAIDMEQSKPCPYQTKGFGDGNAPLCVSFKPKQHEIVWAEKLKWDERAQVVDA